MSEDTPKAGKTPLSDAEKKTRAILAKTLWNSDSADQDFADNAARNAAYKAARKDYLGKAKHLTKALGKRGISLSLAPDAAES